MRREYRTLKVPFGIITLWRDRLSSAFSQNGKFFVSVDSYSVNAYKFPSADVDGIVTRFPSDVYAVGCSDDAGIVIAGAG